MTETDRRWLIIQCKPGHESFAQFRLRKQGFRVWFWHYFRNAAVGRRQRQVTRPRLQPYFPGYLFVKSTRRIGEVLATDAVVAVMMQVSDASPDGVPVTINHRELRLLADLLEVQEDGFVPEQTIDRIDAGPELRAGARFRVLGGPFEDFLATAIDTVPLDARRKIEAYLSVFGRQTRATLDQAQVGEILS